MTDEASGFLSRWSQRKLQQQTPMALEPLSEAMPVPVPAPVVVPPAAAAAVPTEAPPTLADVATLHADSDYSRFVGPGVDGGVKNAALKKLFTDPHFNVMDGLDTYIEDYGLPDPLPAGMLRQMAQSQFLGLFQDDRAQADPPQAAADDENADLRLQPDDAAGRTGPERSPGEDAGREH
jgi:hypothetical protein